MEENQESLGYLNKLALISNSLDNLHSGKKIIVFDLNETEFELVKNVINPQEMGQDKTNFKIEISGNEFLFLLSE
jgi:hypothetical protein